MTEAAAFLDFAEELADAARAAILPHFRAGARADNKAAEGFDPVTAADRAAEQAMRARIHARFPDHGIAGEEFDDHQPDADWTWILDPIDGTRAFLCDLPTWGVLIGLAWRGRPVLGVMDQPFTGERWRAVAGGAADAACPRAGRRAIRTRACPRLAEAAITTTDPALFSAAERAGFEAVRTAARLTRYGLDCYGYAMTAQGGIDAVIESGLKPVDIAALIPIVEAAGGAVTDWEGRPAADARPLGGRIVAVGDRRLLGDILPRLRAGA